MLRVDATGESLLWAKRYPGFYSELNAPLIRTQDGNVVMGGFITTTGSHTRGAVAKLTLAGDVIWAKSAYAEDKLRADLEGEWTSYGYDTVGLAGNGDIILAQGFGNDGVMLTRFSPDGTGQWSRVFHWTVARGLVNTWATQVIADGDDLLLVGSSTGFQYPAHNTDANFNAYIARLTSDGVPIWVRSIGRTAQAGSYRGDRFYDYGTSLLLTQDRQLVLTGYTDAFSNPVGAPQEPWHFDLFVAVTRSSGLLADPGGLEDSADVQDPEEVLTKGVRGMAADVLLDPTAFQTDLANEPVTYATTDAALNARALPSDTNVALNLTYDKQDKVLVSNVSLLQDTASDQDKDGIRQDWENRALQLVNPVITVDEEENWLKNRAADPVVNFAAASPFPSATDPQYVLLTYAVSWSIDYGALYGEIEAHRGDVERIQMAWRIIGHHRVKLEWVYLSAHAGGSEHSAPFHAKDRTCNLTWIADPMPPHEPYSSQVLCATLEFNSDGLLVVQASAGKHAVYPTAPYCKDVTLVWPAFGEDCGWDPLTIAGHVVPGQ